MRPRALWAVATMLLLSWLVLMVAGVWFFYQRFESHITVREQPMTVRLPPGLPALAEVSLPVRLRLPPLSPIEVPVRQTVAAELRDSVQARVQMNTVLPVNATVQVDHDVAVHTTARVNVPVHAWLPRLDVRVPLTITLPVHLAVPVRANVPLDLDMQITGELRERIQVPLATTFRVRPQVQGEILAHLQDQTALHLVGPQRPVPMTIVHTRLKVPFDLRVLTRPQP